MNNMELGNMPYELADIGTNRDLWSTIMGFSDLPVGEKLTLSRNASGLGALALNPNQLVTSFKKSAAAYNTALISGDTANTSVLLTHMLSILHNIYGNLLLGRSHNNRFDQQIYVTVGLEHVYPLFEVLFDQYGFNRAFHNYPYGAYGSVIIDAGKNIPGAEEMVRFFEAKYPDLGSSSVNGIIGTTANQVGVAIRQN